MASSTEELRVLDVNDAIASRAPKWSNISGVAALLFIGFFAIASI